MKKLFAALISSAVILLAGCAKSGGASGGQSDSAPDDTPWNNGLNAIMETESGFYSNQRTELTLRYYEKGSDVEVFLCPKPECLHDGNDGCTATFRNMQSVNTVLYNGDLYILCFGKENGKVGYMLYRAKGDGSALDKIGNALVVPDTKELAIANGVFFDSPGADFIAYQKEPFIIHRGYAYIPLYIFVGTEFAGGGLIQMDIKTGKTKQIYESESLKKGRVMNLKGVGDHVYCDIDDRTTHNSYTMRYSLSDGSFEKAPMDFDTIYYWADENYLYGKFGGETSDGIYRADKETGKFIGAFIQTDKRMHEFDFMGYEDKYFIFTDDEVSVYDSSGGKLGAVAVPEQKINENMFSYTGGIYTGVDFLRFDNQRFKICGGRVFMVNLNTAEILNEDGRLNENLYNVFSCPIDDIISGTGKWTHEYDVKGVWAISKGEYIDKRYDDMR